MTKFDYRPYLKIVFIVTMIYLGWLMRTPYIIGWMFGATLIAYVMLFPSPFMLIMMDKVFDYSKNDIKGMQHEAEKAKEKNRVRFKTEN